MSEKNRKMGGQLVLSRKAGESIDMTCEDGTKIKITAIEFQGGSRVKLMFNAPKSVKILRSELEPEAV